MTDIRVLIADDDPVILRLLEKHLNKAGFETLKASNGNDALKLALSEGPQIIITDWEMPGMDGVELCRMLRDAEGIGLVHIIVLTSHSDKSRVVEAFDAGADDYLSKPFHRGELLARLKAGMRVIELESNLARQNREIIKNNAELAILNSKLEKMATTDELTGLANRRFAIERFESYWAAAERHGSALSCIMLDIDHFKRINDTFGHHIGDQALRQVAASLNKHTRIDDLTCRLGGEEFLIICPNTSIVPAAELANRLREKIAAEIIQTDETELSLTVSLGVAERDSISKNVDDLIRQSDDALYSAKHSGRNRVVLAGQKEALTAES